MHKRKVYLCTNPIAICAQRRFSFVHKRWLRLCTNLKRPPPKGFRRDIQSNKQKCVSEKYLLIEKIRFPNMDIFLYSIDERYIKNEYPIN